MCSTCWWTHTVAIFKHTEITPPGSCLNSGLGLPGGYQAVGYGWDGLGATMMYYDPAGPGWGPVATSFSRLAGSGMVDFNYRWTESYGY